MIVLKAGRIATGAERPKPPLQWLRRGSLHCSDPPRPPRPAGSPGTKGGVCCLCRREPSTDISPSSRGRPSARQGRAAWTHTRRFPPSSPGAAAAPAAASPAALRPLRSARSEQLQVCLALEQLLVAANEAPKQKGSCPRASSPAGRNPAQDIGYTAPLQREWGSQTRVPPPRNPSGFRSSGVTVPTARGAGPTTGQNLGEGEIGESGTH